MLWYGAQIISRTGECLEYWVLQSQKYTLIKQYLLIYFDTVEIVLLIIMRYCLESACAMLAL